MLVWISDLGMKKGFPEITGNPICGAKGIRTPDPLHAMEMRYQLRHSPKFIYQLLFEPIDNLPQVGMKTKLGVSYSLRHPRHPSHPPKVPSEDG